MTSLSRRLQRLEATTTRLNLSERSKDFEEFSRTAGDYIRAVRQYLLVKQKLSGRTILHGHSFPPSTNFAGTTVARLPTGRPVENLSWGVGKPGNRQEKLVVLPSVPGRPSSLAAILQKNY